MVRHPTMLQRPRKLRLHLRMTALLCGRGLGAPRLAAPGFLRWFYPFYGQTTILVALCPSSGPSVVPVMVESESGDAVLRLGLVGEFGRPYRDGGCLVLC